MIVSLSREQIELVQKAMQATYKDGELVASTNAELADSLVDPCYGVFSISKRDVLALVDGYSDEEAAEMYGFTRSDLESLADYQLEQVAYEMMEWDCPSLENLDECVSEVLNLPSPRLLVLDLDEQS